jgi:putative autotransporter adhesin-like protein
MSTTSASTHHSSRLVLVVVALLAAAVAAAVTLFVVRDGDDGVSGSGAGVQGSGVTASETRSVPAFDAVDLVGSNVVAVRVGDPRSVVVRGDDNLLALVTTEVRDGVLVLGTSGSFSTDQPMTVEVAVPSLDAVALSGSGVVTVEGVAAEELVARLPGSGVLTVRGTAQRLDAALAGSGRLLLGELVAQEAKAVVSGSGELEVHATRVLDATVSGSGTIAYRGDPATVKQQVTGSGAIFPG